jgi:hypothetical protein
MQSFLQTLLTFDTAISGFEITGMRTAFNACKIRFDLSKSALTDADIEKLFDSPLCDEYTFSGDTIAPRVFEFGYRDFPDCITAIGYEGFFSFIAEIYCDKHDDLFFDFYGAMQAQSVNCDCAQCIERRAQ